MPFAIVYPRRPFIGCYRHMCVCGECVCVHLCARARAGACACMTSITICNLTLLGTDICIISQVSKVLTFYFDYLPLSVSGVTN